MPRADTPTPGKPKALRPRNAATLIIVNRDGNEPRVLMGKRHENHKFMPGKFVFPGGRVDYADTRITPVADLPPTDMQRLQKRFKGRPSEARARSLALAAVRETFEETGIPLGQAVDADRPNSRSLPWQAFFDTGTQPDLSMLRFLARAITPPGRPRRYDTRFFMTFADQWRDVSFNAKPSDELTEVLWVGLRDAQDLDLPRVTGVVLKQLESHLSKTEPAMDAKGVPFFYHRPSGWKEERL